MEARLTKKYNESTKPLNLWGEVCGPASACAATIFRIGWSAAGDDGWKRWRGRDGTEYDLMAVNPHDLKQAMCKDIQTSLWAASSICATNSDSKEGDRPWLAPMREEVFGKDKQVGAMVRSVAINTQWTQDRIAEAGYVEADDDKCKLCNEEKGTLLHRNGCGTQEFPGCEMLSCCRANILKEAAIEYVKKVKGSFLITSGMMMESELPDVETLQGYSGKEVWTNPHHPKVFRGDTFVDGSCVPCRHHPSLSRAGYSVVSICDQLHNTQENDWELPDEVDCVDCRCNNRHMSAHECTDYCKEHQGCDGECKKKKKHQRRIIPEVHQAMCASLPGPHPTTPRAELMAIYQAIKWGESPQTIISDHENHVRDLRAMGRGSKRMLHRKNPNLDLWRKIKAEVDTRGGIDQHGENKLWIQWQRAHQRASRSETTEQRQLRRGNDAADHYANEGRKLHNDVEPKRIRVSYLRGIARNWAQWVGTAAALQYDTEFEGCDHTLPSQSRERGKPGRRSEKKRSLPDEARVLRRLSWAKNSEGSLEHHQPLREEDTPQEGQAMPQDDDTVDLAAHVVKRRRLSKKTHFDATERYIQSFQNLFPARQKRCSASICLHASRT